MNQVDIRHVDEFIDDPKEDAYARWVFMYFRFSAVFQRDFKIFWEGHKLFCNYRDRRWRVTGASRMGDVWLTEDFSQETGYQKRVFIEYCSHWDKKP